MAEGLVNHLYVDKAKAVSAGTDPRPVHPLAIKAMQELGIDISKQCSKQIETFSGESFDLFITLCDRAKESCPLNFEGKRRLHVGFKDPAEKNGTPEEIFAEFRIIRDAINMWLHDYFDVMEVDR